MDKKKQIIIAVVSIVVVLIVSLGISYAFFVSNISGTKENIIKVGTLSLALDEATSEGINIENAYPLSDIEGLKLKGYTFTLSNTGDLTSLYSISLIDQAITNTRMSDNIVKYNLSIDNIENPSTGNEVTSGNPKLLSSVDNRIITSGTIAAGEKITFTLKLWMDYNAGNEYQNSEFNTKISVTGTQTGIE